MPVVFKPAEPKPAPAPAPTEPTAESLSRTGKFAEAARLTQEKIARGGKEIEGTYESTEWLILASTRLAAGDRDGYRAACVGAVHRFQPDADPGPAERTAKAILLAPNSGIEATKIAEILGTAQSGLEKPTWAHWVQIDNALAEYRSGRFDAAADWVAKLHANPECPARGQAAGNAVLAMAEFQRKRPAEARAALEAARKSVAAGWPQGGEGSWYSWLVADLLTKEAASLVK